MSTLSLFALTVMTSCDGAGITIDDAVANQRVVDAMEQMMTTQIDSFEIDVTADAEYLGRFFDGQSVENGRNELDANGEVHVKVNDLFGDDAIGSVEASATVYAKEGQTVLIDSELEAALYLSEGWVYADITNATAFITAIGQTPPPVTTVKKQVGNLATALGFDPEAPIDLPIELEDALPYLNELQDIKATEKDGELSVVYTITVNDIVNVAMKVAADSGQFDPTQMTSEDIEGIRSTFYTRISSVVSIAEAKITLGVGADGFLSKLYADLDIAVTIAKEGEGQGHELHELDASFHIDISNVNQVVDVVLPDNLAQYTEIHEDQPTV
jgi:hypothetical protein